MTKKTKSLIVLLLTTALFSGCVLHNRRPDVTERGNRVFRKWYELPYNVNVALHGIELVNEALLNGETLYAQRLTYEYDIAISDMAQPISEVGASWQLGLHGYYIEYERQWSDFTLTCTEEDTYRLQLVPHDNDVMQLDAVVLSDVTDNKEPFRYYKVNGQGKKKLTDDSCDYYYQYTLTDVLVPCSTSFSPFGGKVDLQVIHPIDNDTLELSVQFSDGYYHLTYLGMTDKYYYQYYYYE